MCQHDPRCPEWLAPDRGAARVVAAQPSQGWSLLCNGVVAFDDGGQLFPDARASDQARENRAYVRRLLRQRQPKFAAALAAAERQFSCAPGPDERRNDDDVRAAHLSR